jgi:ribosomal subunit interface protein
MNVQIYFRHLDPSESLSEYVITQLEGINRFLLKEGRWHVEFSKRRHEISVHIKVASPWGYFESRAQSDDYYTTVDLACDKLIMQVKKKKSQLQHHKKPHKSKRARLEYMNPELEYFPVWELKKKVA